jgi:hypothetical protein
MSKLQFLPLMEKERKKPFINFLYSIYVRSLENQVSWSEMFGSLRCDLQLELYIRNSEFDYLLEIRSQIRKWFRLMISGLRGGDSQDMLSSVISIGQCK